MIMSSEIYVERYKKACGLAQSRKWEAALEAYEQVFDPLPVDETTGEAAKGIADSDLVGIVEVYKADCLRMLDRLEEAKQIIDGPLVQGIVPRFSNLGYLYEYCVIHGFVLGELGNIPGMGNMLTKAMGIASNVLRDSEKVVFCWTRMANYAIEHHDWHYLLQIAERAHQFGKETGAENFIYWAEEHTVLAYSKLENKREAKKIASAILKRYRNTKQTEKIAMWEAIMASLEK